MSDLRCPEHGIAMRVPYSSVLRCPTPTCNWAIEAGDIPINSAYRRYLPTLAELIDRLCIVQLKEIFISEHAEAYRKERADIEHDINLLISEQDQRLGAKDVHAIIMLAIANLTIWNNESKARLGTDEQNHLLRFTHSINGIRARAKNVIAVNCGERVDVKADSLAADIPPEYGNWKIF